MNIKINKIKCVIFDCDGVLVDSEKLCCQALVNVFTDFGVKEVTCEDIMAHFNGGKLAEILTEIKQRLEISLSLDELEPAYRKEAERLYSVGLKPIDGSMEVLDALDQLGIDYCVVSNNPREKIELSLKLTGLKDKIGEKYFSGFDANSWKPEPDLILYAAMNMGYSADECIYIDDTVKGLEAGVQAGVKTYHFRTEQSILNSGYPHVTEISDIRQVTDLLS
ncbi:HAD-IA family hydrolase [Vibrio sp. JC009]|uniref:HAD-IA family hydrolase n=1 Tax=Vibrio sp. JC009 TaxID=2912314 RepID=UPI0023AF6CAF|nr:HAD-IA family hydrolase [Vibrio sp. JC009]WED24461.1 HAD-IA family hydrolase [Vibrio sp. JC009]